ncbi:hypothetical protein BDR26DRAFT_177277 [Obelidium mucronatum]|nr:hypothetical protein BDR26DRAFT_177277 [Obelidium mucronatum]
MTRLTAHPAHAIAVCFVSYFSGLIAALPFQQLLIVTICHQIDRVQTFTITDDEYERCARRTDVNSEMASLVLNLNLAEQVAINGCSFISQLSGKSDTHPSSPFSETRSHLLLLQSLLDTLLTKLDAEAL